VETVANPINGGLLMPAEWAPQRALWIGFPHLAEEWPGVFTRAQEQIAAFANTVAETGQEVRLLVRGEANETRARALVSTKVTLERRIYGDIWLRDTGPLIVREGIEGGDRLAAQVFAFNGWGDKYRMPGDETIGADLAWAEGLPVTTSAMVFEGGAVDGDGTGLAIATEECLLNPNRNPGLSRAAIEAELTRMLGFERVVWLGCGLMNDHTDGHVDNLARFVAQGTVALPEAIDDDDPNAAIYADAADRLCAAGLTLARIPSPGRIERDGRVEPASYVNFAIANACVIVPTFGSPHDDAGVAAIADLFPGREVVGLPADAVLAGGGGFHCASQQLPVL
jgi:agmatine deiminase